MIRMAETCFKEETRGGGAGNNGRDQRPWEGGEKQCANGRSPLVGTFLWCRGTIQTQRDREEGCREGEVEARGAVSREGRLGSGA